MDEGHEGGRKQKERPMGKLPRRLPQSNQERMMKGLCGWNEWGEEEDGVRDEDEAEEDEDDDVDGDGTVTTHANQNRQRDRTRGLRIDRAPELVE